MSRRAQLTEVQQKVYKFIVEFIRKNRYPPTLREIQEHFGYGSSNTVAIHLKKITNKGYIAPNSKGGPKFRAIRLVDDIIGLHTVNMSDLSSALAKIKERGYNVPANEAVELLRELKIEIDNEA
jgi:SOS-response transcriptional repressor LexA